jgi:hypothetical protein
MARPVVEVGSADPGSVSHGSCRRPHVVVAGVALPSNSHSKMSSVDQDAGRGKKAPPCHLDRVGILDYVFQVNHFPVFLTDGVVVDRQRVLGMSVEMFAKISRLPGLVWTSLADFLGRH